MTAENIRAELVRADGSANERSVWRRVQAARELGLVNTERMVAGVPAAVWLTREGMDLVGVAGDVTRPRLSTFLHDLHVLELAQWLVVDKPQHRLVTEREMRREDTPNQSNDERPQWAVNRRGASGSAVGGHTRVYPDLITVRSDGLHLVHEVEASQKDVRRLVRLMMSYLHAADVAGVRYYCLPAARPRVERAAAEAVQRAAEQGLDGRRLSVTDWDALPFANAKETRP